MNVPCDFCGCTGNMSCGHEPVDKELCCTLVPVGCRWICGCCKAKEASR